MANGNDGNYLQHSIEVALAVRLAALDFGGRLHIMLCNGMAPFERCDPPRDGQAVQKLNLALKMSCIRPNQRKLRSSQPTGHQTLHKSTTQIVVSF